MKSLLSTTEAAGVMLPHDLVPDDHPLVYHNGRPLFEKFCQHDPPETGFAANARNMDRFIGLAVVYYNKTNGTDYVLCDPLYQRASFYLNGEGSYIHCVFNAAPSTDVSAFKLFHFDFHKETDKFASCVILDELSHCEHCRYFRPPKLAKRMVVGSPDKPPILYYPMYEPDKKMIVGSHHKPPILNYPTYAYEPDKNMVYDKPPILYYPTYAYEPDKKMGLGSHDKSPNPYSPTYAYEPDKNMVLGSHDKPPIPYSPTYAYEPDKKMVVGSHDKPPILYNPVLGYDKKMALGSHYKPPFPYNPVLGSDKKLGKRPMPNPIVSMLEKEKIESCACVIPADPGEVSTPLPPFYSGDLATGVSLSDRAKLRLEFVLPPLAYYNKKQNTNYKLVDALPYCTSFSPSCEVAHGNFIARQGDGRNKLFFAEHENRHGVWVVVGCRIVRGKTNAGCLRCTKSKWARQVIHPTGGFRHGLFRHGGRLGLRLRPLKGARY